jgi:hypothetical protein
MAIATVDDIVAGLASAQDVPYQKTFAAPKAAGAFQSGWLAAGFPGAGSASPAYTAGSGYACDKTTAGAVPFTDAAVQAWIARMGMACSQPGTLIIADRLWSCSGMGFAASTYTVTTPGNLPARITDNGVDCELWVEQFVAAGAASGTLTANYLNANTGAAKSGVIAAVVSAPVAGQMQPVPLAAGDTGIRQLTSLVNSATWTSGTFGATILKRIIEIPIASANNGLNLDWAALGLPKIPNAACLFAFFLANGTTAPVVIGSLDIIDK